MKKTITIDPERCKGCGLCVSICPKDVLGLDHDAMNTRGYHPTSKIHPDACIYCGMCTLICPDLAILLLEEEE